jgi:FkbM family methyltransferase
MNPIDVTIHGKQIRVFNDNPRFINEVIEGNEYIDLFGDLTVIDLGANIGTFSIWIYEHAKVIHAIEPSKECVELLQQTKDYNNLDRLFIHNLAISGTGGMREIDDESDPSGGSWKLTNGTHAQHLVPTQTIDQFMAEQDLDYVDVLKIDVEGAEYEIIYSTGFRVAAPKIQKIIGEFHSDHQVSELVSTLQSLGYLVRVDNSHFIARRI